MEWEVDMDLSSLITIVVAIAVLWLVWKVISGVFKFVVSIAIVAGALYLLLGNI